MKISRKCQWWPVGSDRRCNGQPSRAILKDGQFMGVVCKGHREQAQEQGFELIKISKVRERTQLAGEPAGHPDRPFQPGVRTGNQTLKPSVLCAQPKQNPGEAAHATKGTSAALTCIEAMPTAVLESQ